jgi:hypothetical protein
MAFPRKYLALVARLLPSLIEGDHPALVALREQFRCARIREVELTGVGFYVDFDVPSHAPLADPADFAGGNATITLDGAANGAGCVLFVRDGRLASLEGYTYGDPWPEDARIISVEDIMPVSPSKAGG